MTAGISGMRECCTECVQSKIEKGERKTQRNIALGAGRGCCTDVIRQILYASRNSKEAKSAFECIGITAQQEKKGKKKVTGYREKCYENVSKLTGDTLHGDVLTNV